jgi:hypothetical protein
VARVNTELTYLRNKRIKGTFGLNCSHQMFSQRYSIKISATSISSDIWADGGAVKQSVPTYRVSFLRLRQIFTLHFTPRRQSFGAESGVVKVRFAEGR